MLPCPLENATRILAEDQPEYMPLHIRDFVDPETGWPVMLSLWQPSAEELAALAAGGFVQLRICGNVHPPVLLGVQPAGATEDREHDT